MQHIRQKDQPVWQLSTSQHNLLASISPMVLLIHGDNKMDHSLSAIISMLRMQFIVFAKPLHTWTTIKDYPSSKLYEQTQDHSKCHCQLESCSRSNLGSPTTLANHKDLVKPSKTSPIPFHRLFKASPIVLQILHFPSTTSSMTTSICYTSLTHLRMKLEWKSYSFNQASEHSMWYIGYYNIK